MYLKRLEIIGFKSFANKTRLEFEPGMTAIVGPNGCGKSNVSDAVRWVLGEQSAKALRGGKMEDVIFNGTDEQKALGMAEVSMTLADCEEALGMEYNEVTITRRVFRSGEGQYFINKAPCRLKDIQRLFMDTGIGTNSYSIMEQGKIDRILSSRPEDRRSVFEEASGITKFKADKKEAMRKLEHTEANLLRLDDIIREVKRQIISLQRQAGKARRYQEMRDQLQSYDVYMSRQRLDSLTDSIKTLESTLASLQEQDEAVRADIETSEAGTEEFRTRLDKNEADIAQTMEEAVRARTELERVHELIRHNGERITELKELSERDTRDMEDARIRLEQHRKAVDQENTSLARATEERDNADRELEAEARKLREREQEVEQTNQTIHKLRSEQVDLDARIAQLQNERNQIDAEERQNDLRRERLAAELSETRRALEILQEREQDMTARLNQLRQDAATAQQQHDEATGSRKDKNAAIAGLKKELSELQPEAAARRAKIDLLTESKEKREGFPEGARRILDRSEGFDMDPAIILGPLAEALQAEDRYKLALETVLRPWLDAIVIRHDNDAADLLRRLEAASAGSARMLTVPARAPAPAPADGDRLLDHIRGPEPILHLLGHLIGHVLVADDAGSIPNELPEGVTYVTLEGGLRTRGKAEFWRRDEAGENPLARQQLLEEWTRELETFETRIREREQRVETLQGEEAKLEQWIAEAAAKLKEAHRALDTTQGEFQVLQQQKKEAGDRVDTVGWELKALEERQGTGGDRRKSIGDAIDECRARQNDIRDTVRAGTESLKDLENARSKAQGIVTDLRVRYSERRQTVEHLSSRIEQLQSRVQELESLISERNRGVDTYRDRIGDLQAGIERSNSQIEPLEARVRERDDSLENLKANKESLQGSLSEHEKQLRQLRAAHEEILKKRSQSDVELGRQQERRQNLIERVTGDYRITVEDLLEAKEPEWEGEERPDNETIETRIAELRAKLEAMGPVNLVAIEEHAELEERYAFLTAQNSDLINAKQQLIEMIREINQTTTQLFSETFDKVNANFEQMFTQIFGGGTAKLVLTDEGDILESGIEIIARPPGKKLQTVSLLSGGERTMTAVALLFSLYMVKPSPFCVLDELDAALDDANIGRFVKTVQGFVEYSQFIVITHNRQTIAAAQTLYGVTMEKRGISKIVSVKFSDIEDPGTGKNKTMSMAR